MELTKSCSRCKVIKPISDFSKSKRDKDGHRSACKECVRLDYFANHDEEKALRRQNYASNKEAYKARSRVWKLENPDKVYSTVHARKQKIKSIYGLSWETYEDMFLKQGGKCKICGDSKELWPEKKTDGLYVDHCHATQAVRGLLCCRCNAGLGQFRDNPVFLKSAVEYLHGID